MVGPMAGGARSVVLYLLNATAIDLVLMVDPAPVTLHSKPEIRYSMAGGERITWCSTSSLPPPSTWSSRSCHCSMPGAYGESRPSQNLTYTPLLDYLLQVRSTIARTVLLYLLNAPTIDLLLKVKPSNINPKPYTADVFGRERPLAGV